MNILIPTLIGLILLVYAHFPELKHYYKMSKTRGNKKFTDAATANRLTKMSIAFSSTKYCIICRHMFLKKTIWSAAAYSIMFLTLSFIVITCPVEMPQLLSGVLGSYIWVAFSCYLLLRFIRHTKMHVGESIALAIIIPPCIYILLYIFLPQLR